LRHIAIEKPEAKMSRIDPECFPQTTYSGKHVCSNCFHDNDLRRYVTMAAQTGMTCSYCEVSGDSVSRLEDIADFIEQRMLTF